MLKSTSTASRRMMLQGVLASTVLAACSSNNGTPPNKPDNTNASPSSPSDDVPKARSTDIPTQTTSFTTASMPRATQTNPHPVIGSVPTGSNNQMALTLDDGVNPHVMAGYLELAASSNLRLTMFANGQYTSWVKNKDLIAPLLDSGKLQIGNHTWNHPKITTLNDAQLNEQLTLNEDHFTRHFNYDIKPYFRPPYGIYDSRTYTILRSRGYKAICMWYGTLGDENAISASTIMKNARTYCLPGRVVIGHLNHSGIMDDYGLLHDLLDSRDITTVTLKDIYGN